VGHSLPRSAATKLKIGARQRPCGSADFVCLSDVLIATAPWPAKISHLVSHPHNTLACNHTDKAPTNKIYRRASSEQRPRTRGAHWRNLRLARGSTDSVVFVLAATCSMLRQDLIPGLTPAQHNTLARNNTSLPPPSVLPPPHTHTFQHTIFFCKIIDPRLCVRFFVKGARSVGPPTPTHLGKVYKRALVVPLSSPHQRAFVCGTCIVTAQVGVSLVSLFQSTLQTV